MLKEEHGIRTDVIYNLLDDLRSDIRCARGKIKSIRREENIEDVRLKTLSEIELDLTLALNEHTELRNQIEKVFKIISFI